MADYRDRIKHSDWAAEKYDRRNPVRDLAEINLVRRAFERVTGVKTALDAPCGTGRMSILMHEQGFDVCSADLGEGALKQAGLNFDQAGIRDIKLIKANLEQLLFEDNSFDLVLCFRLYHHLPTETARKRVIGELCRVSKRHVLISYIHTLAYTSLRRGLKKHLLGKTSKQHATSLVSIERHFLVHGFSLSRDLPQQRFFHSLHLAVFEGSE